jgi:hypothetical protein
VDDVNDAAVSAERIRSNDAVVAFAIAFDVPSTGGAGAATQVAIATTSALYAVIIELGETSVRFGGDTTTRTAIAVAVPG